MVRVWLLKKRGSVDLYPFRTVHSWEVVSWQSGYHCNAGPALPCVGRTPMEEYLKAEAYVTFTVGTEQFLACRRSLYRAQPDGFVRRDVDLCGGLDEEKARLLAKMAWAEKPETVLECFLALGAVAPLHDDPRKNMQIFSRYALVQVGPRAKALWKQEHARSVPAAPHDRGACLWCSAIMLEGGCEHLYLAFQVFQLEDFTVCCPVESKKKKGSSAGLKDATQDRDNVQKEEVGDGCDVEESGHSLEGFGVAQEGASSSSRYQPELEEKVIARSLKSYEFFEVVANKRKQKRLPTV